MESLYIVIDKCITMIAKLKNIREEIKLLSDCGEEFNKLKNDYVSNICKEYSDVYQGTERYITNQDYDIYVNYQKNVIKLPEITSSVSCCSRERRFILIQTEFKLKFKRSTNLCKKNFRFGDKLSDSCP